jgi:hypothetical protein
MRPAFPGLEQDLAQPLHGQVSRPEIVLLSPVGLGTEAGSLGAQRPLMDKGMAISGVAQVPSRCGL